MKKISVLAVALSMAACQPKHSPAGDEDSVVISNTDTPLPDTPLVVDTVAVTLPDSTKLPGRWLRPVEGIDSLQQGFTLKKNGKAVSINMHALLYDKWKLYRDTLVMWSHKEGGTNTIDTLLVKSLDDTLLVLFPINAAQGYLERYKRKRK